MDKFMGLVARYASLTRWRPLVLAGVLLARRVCGDLEEHFLQAGVSHAVAGHVQFGERRGRVQRREQALVAALARLVERQDVVQFVIRLRF